MPGLDEKGHEIPDSTPMALPVGFKRPESLQDQIRRLIRSERLAMEASSLGRETFEEADDFDVGDDYDPTSPYEEVFEPREAPEVLEKLARPSRQPKGQKDLEEEIPVRSEDDEEEKPRNAKRRKKVELDSDED